MKSVNLAPVIDYVNGLGTWGPAIFIAVYIIGVVFFVPGSALTLAASLLFGVVHPDLRIDSPT